MYKMINNMTDSCRRKNIVVLTIDHIPDRGIYLNILLKDSPFNSLQNTM